MVGLCLTKRFKADAGKTGDLNIFAQNTLFFMENINAQIPAPLKREAAIQLNPGFNGFRRPGHILFTPKSYKTSNG
jgi:hypothetical protein